MDELQLDFPFARSRMLRDLLNADGVEIGRLHVATLMKRIGIEAIYRKPNTSKPAPGHKIYPYLLRKMQAVRPVWAMDRSASRWRAASSISPPWSIGSAAGFSGIGCRSPWKPTSGKGLMARQCRRRAALAIRQIRGGVSQSGGSRLDRKLSSNQKLCSNKPV
jgi:hypothetical protein